MKIGNIQGEGMQYATAIMQACSACIRVSITLFLCASFFAFFQPALPAYASSPPYWSAQTRIPLTITNTSTTTALPIGYTITDEIDTLSGAAATSLHVIYWNGSTNTELDRDYETDSNTGKVYARFELQTSIPISGSNSTNYWLYYGNTNNPGAPKANLSNVYQHYDDFTNIGSGNTWDSSYWGSENSCIVNLSNGITIAASGASGNCGQYSISSYGIGYATEFTIQPITASGNGTNELDAGFVNWPNEAMTMLKLGSSLNWQSANSGDGTNYDYTLISSASYNKNYLVSTARSSSSKVNYVTDFQAVYNSYSYIPTDNELVLMDANTWDAAASMTAKYSAFRLRLAIDSEPTASNGSVQSPSTTNLSWNVSSNQVSAANAEYTWEYTTQSTGTLISLTMSVPSGTSGTPTLAENYGIGAGTVVLSNGFLTYTITSPTSVSSGIPFYLALTGLTNTPTPQSFQSTLTTYTSSGTLDNDTSAATTFSSNNTALTLLVAESAIVTAPSVTSYTELADPLINKNLTFSDGGFKVITNAGNGWTLNAQDATNGLYDTTSNKAITPVSTNIAGAVGSFPTSTDANAFGYNISTVVPDASCSSGCGTVINNLTNKWAGFTHGSIDTPFISSNGPTGDNGVTFHLNYQIALSFAVGDAPGSSNKYTDTITYTYNGSY
jgi:hypothetical protein